MVKHTAHRYVPNHTNHILGGIYKWPWVKRHTMSKGKWLYCWCWRLQQGLMALQVTSHGEKWKILDSLLSSQLLGCHASGSGCSLWMQVLVCIGFWHQCHLTPCCAWFWVVPVGSPPSSQPCSSSFWWVQFSELGAIIFLHHMVHGPCTWIVMVVVLFLFLLLWLWWPGSTVGHGEYLPQQT